MENTQWTRLPHGGTAFSFGDGNSGSTKESFDAGDGEAEDRKPSVLVSVLCGRERDTWINPALFMSLLNLRHSSFDVVIETAYDMKPHEYARNTCVLRAQAVGYTHLCMVDNDMVLPGNFDQILAEVITSGKAVVGLQYGALEDNGGLKMLSCHDNGHVDGNFRRTGLVGGGVLIINADVWGKIPGPWFRWLSDGSEISKGKISEDYYFCELVQENGLEVWTHKQAAGHLKTLDITSVCKKLALDTITPIRITELKIMKGSEAVKHFQDEVREINL